MSERHETFTPDFDVEQLKTDVANLLITEHDMLTEEAEESVNNSYSNRPDFWTENAAAKDLANLLASDDDDE